MTADPRSIGRSQIPAAAAVMTLALLSACGQGNKYVAPPPPKVTVVAPVQQQVTNYLETTGNAAAINTADLVARVQGFVQEINYQDGDQVKAGAPLFLIEPEPYELKLKQSQAAQSGAQATRIQTEAEYKRQADLQSRQVSTQALLDTATANRDSAAANLQQADVNTRLAAINLGYAHVSAPFDGIVTARKVSIGQLVGASSPTVLATIVQIDPIYVNFTISEQDVLRIRAAMARHGLSREDLKKVPAEIGLQSDNGYPHSGFLDYAAPAVDPSTGTLTARAILQNDKRVLLPGYFVRVRIPLGPPQPALLVPDTALGSDQSGRYVLVVNRNNVVEQRVVEIGRAVGDLRVIEKGLAPDDRVIVAGMLRALPGQAVDPQTRSAAAAADGAKTD